MRAIFFCLLALTTILPTAASQAEAPQNIPLQTASVVLHKDTPVFLQLAEDVNSRTAREDEPVEFTVAEPVKEGDVVLVDAGSRAIGTVTRSVLPGFYGDPGELQVKLTFLKAATVKVPIRGAKSQSGENRALLRGTEAVIKRGTPVIAYVEADTELQVSPDLAAKHAAFAASAQMSNKIRLPYATPVQLMLTEPVSSKTAKPGDAVKLRVLEDVKVGDLIVIPARAPATASITEAKAAGMAWHKGQLAIRVDTVTLIDQQQLPVKLATQFSGKPTMAAFDWGSAIWLTQGLAAFALPFAPLQHGNQAALHGGTVLEAVTSGDILLDTDKVQSLQPKESPRGEGPALVTFYFPGLEEAGSHEIHIGTTKLGNLKPGRKVTCKFSAGQYSLHLGKKAPPLKVDLQEGTEYYVRVGFLHADVSGPKASGLTIVPHDVGEIESIETWPAEWKTLPDTMNLKPEISR